MSVEKAVTAIMGSHADSPSRSDVESGLQRLIESRQQCLRDSESIGFRYGLRFGLDIIEYSDLKSVADQFDSCDVDELPDSLSGVQQLRDYYLDSFDYDSEDGDEAKYTTGFIRALCVVADALGEIDSSVTKIESEAAEPSLA